MFCPKSTIVLPDGLVVTETGVSSSIRRIGGASVVTNVPRLQSNGTAGVHALSSNPGALQPSGSSLAS